jgi:GTP-binding protein
MRFIDEIRLHVISGVGGNGCIAFRREKFVPMGGPSGGDGGRGGDVVLVATQGRTTLLELRGKTIWRARRGEHGRGSQQTGACAKHIEITVPVGTRVFDEQTDEVLADLTVDGERWIAAEGGQGGQGNMRFKSATNRAPRKKTPGGPGIERYLRLELMLMADVGLLGFPNAGKSTLIRQISAAKPRVADYPFTTLVPSLGVVDMGFEGTFTVADIPGLIEGASEGTGLGHQFLRHVSRTRLLLHLVSAAEHDEGHVHSGDDQILDPLRRYLAIRHELKTYDPDLAARDEMVILTKSDVTEPDRMQEIVDCFTAETGRAPLVISAPTKAGLDPLKIACWERIQATVQLCEEE